MAIKIWVLRDYICFISSKALFFLLLVFGLGLPWRMRVRYSEFLITYGEKIEDKILYLPVKIHFERAVKYFNKKKLTKAIKEFKRAEEFNSLSADINMCIAKCYRQLGENDKYLLEISKAINKSKYTSSQKSKEQSKQI